MAALKWWATVGRQRGTRARVVLGVADRMFHATGSVEIQERSRAVVAKANFAGIRAFLRPLGIDAAVVESLPGLRTTPGVGAATPVAPDADLPQVPGYELSGEVGRGGMGVVYRARHALLVARQGSKTTGFEVEADRPPIELARAMSDDAVRIAETSGHAYSMAWACQAAAVAV